MSRFTTGFPVPPLVWWCLR